MGVVRPCLRRDTAGPGGAWWRAWPRAGRARYGRGLGHPRPRRPLRAHSWLSSLGLGTPGCWVCGGFCARGSRLPHLGAGPRRAQVSRQGRGECSAGLQGAMGRPGSGTGRTRRGDLGVRAAVGVPRGRSISNRGAHWAFCPAPSKEHPGRGAGYSLPIGRGRALAPQLSRELGRPGAGAGSPSGDPSDLVPDAEVLTGPRVLRWK